MSNANVIEGTLGSIALPTGHYAKLSHFSVAVGQAVIDVTGFDSAGWMELLGTIKSASGSARGRLTYNATTTAPGLTAMTKIGGAMTLTFFTGCTLAFTAIISNISIDEDAHGEVEVTFNFVSSGACTPVWDETP